MLTLGQFDDMPHVVSALSAVPIVQGEQGHPVVDGHLVNGDRPLCTHMRVIALEVGDVRDQLRKLVV